MSAGFANSSKISIFCFYHLAFSVRLNFELKSSAVNQEDLFSTIFLNISNDGVF